MTLNLHPADGVAAYEEKYPEMAKDMGVDPATKQTIPWINSDKKFMKNMFKNILAPMEKTEWTSGGWTGSRECSTQR